MQHLNLAARSCSDIEVLCLFYYIQHILVIIYIYYFSFQVGLASVVAAVQRSGGSLTHPGPVLDDSLEQMAAGIEGGALPEALFMGGRPRL